MGSVALRVLIFDEVFLDQVLILVTNRQLSWMSIHRILTRFSKSRGCSE